MIHILDLQFKTREAIASFVIPSSEGLILVESGPHSTFTHLEKGLVELGYHIDQVKHLLLTHIHFDHAGAAWALAEKGAKVYVHPRGYKHLLDPRRIYNSAKRIYGDQMEVLWGEMKGINPDLLIQVEDEEELHIGGHPFKAWHTPGHASHHIAWQMDDVVFTGDVAGCKINNGPVVPPCPPPDIDIEAWNESIDRLLKLDLKTLMLTHYGKVEEIEPHFQGLRNMLEDWAQWMKPRFDKGLAPEEITPEFKVYAADQLKDAGLSPEEVAKYEAANPAWMSVAGLLRYWKKKTEAA